MSKQILLLAGAALLFAGTVQAEAPGVQSEQTLTIAKNALVFSATDTEVEAARNCDATSKQDKSEATEELHPDAKPVYLSGEDCGSN